MLGRRQEDAPASLCPVCCTQAVGTGRCHPISGLIRNHPALIPVPHTEIQLPLKEQEALGDPATPHNTLPTCPPIHNPQAEQDPGTGSSPVHCASASLSTALPEWRLGVSSYSAKPLVVKSV